VEEADQRAAAPSSPSPPWLPEAKVEIQGYAVIGSK
jgi:hypothetical protein